MDMSGTRLIAASQDQVWQALLDPDILKACVPGCQELSGSVEEGFTATVVQKVGPVKATFKGEVTFPSLNAPDSLTLSGEGKGGAAGFAKGSADVRLGAAGDSTELTYDVQAKVGGKLAQLGSRIIDGFARKMADQFFDRFQAAVEQPDRGAAASDDAPAQATEKKSWLKRLVPGQS
ncbi:MAG: CoxG family protein [Arenibacterium sp.]